MTTRPSLLRSIPFWVLIGGSLATLAYGAWLFLGTTASMIAGLTDQTATTADVYVGQVVAVVGGILVATGLIWLALAAVLGGVRSLVPAPVAEIVEPIDWTAEDQAVEGEAAAAPVAAQPADEVEEPAPTEGDADPAEPASTPAR